MTRPTLHAALIGLALATALGAVQAQTKKDLVAKAVQLQQPAADALAADLARDTGQRLMTATGPALAQVPVGQREALAKQVQADVKAFYDETLAKLRESATRLAPSTLAPLLEESMTEDELRQLIAWQESSAARKYQQLLPQMQEALARKLAEDTRPAMEPRLRALEQTLQKRFTDAGLAAAPARPASAPAAASSPKPAAAAKPAPKK